MARSRKLAIDWSPYQQAIFEWVKQGTGHALVNAAAGSGKTTTLRGIVENIPSKQKIAVLAFNRHMAAELREKLPQRVTVSTIHSMGMYMLYRRFSTRTLSCNESKVFDLIRQAMQDLRPELRQIPHPKPRELEQEVQSFLKELLHYLQVTLTEPNETGIRWLIKHYSLDTPPEPVLKLLLPWPAKLLEKAKRLATDQLNISMDDLIWLPHALNLNPIPKDWVLVDEAQDLSRAQLELVMKLPSETGRMVFVGDPHQAIFGFAGSDANSWEQIRKAVSPTEFPLSLTYRCPKTHVDLAARIVPQIESRSEAIDGVIQVLHPGEIKHQVKVGDLVICRFTAPLVSLCLKLVIHHRIPARVRGKEMGKMLSTLARTVADKFPRDFLIELRDYVGEKTEQYQHEGRESAIEALRDRANALEVCFETFGMECETIEVFCQRIQELFDDEAAQTQHVILATIHRSKGDEADRVFLLKSDAMPTLSLAANDWQRQQERNLLYVALTRSKQDLYLVPMPKKPEALPALMADPVGGIQFPNPCDKTPLEQTPVTVPNEPIPVSHDDFQIEVDALHQVVRKMFADLVEVIQGFSEDFPMQMQVVVQRLSGEFGSRPAHPRPQQPVRIQQAATANRFFPQLRPGDICRYQGPQGAMNVTCRGRQLCVLEINGEVATVNALPDYFHKGEWSHPHEIEIRHLRKVK